MRTNKFILSFGALIAALLFSCSEKNYLIEEPKHIITSESLYTNLAGFESGLNGMYALVRQEREGWDGVDYLRGEMAMTGTDNVCTNHRDGFSRIAELWKETNNAFNDDIIKNFEWLYQTINAANTIINRSENPDINWRGNNKSEEENKNGILAEARALRAWAYRHLAFLWGDVPISLEESLGSNIKTDWNREPVEQVWKQVKQDLLYSESYLETDPIFQGRITKGAVQHYLAEVYLVLNKPDSSLFWANKCINTPEYKLITDRYGVKASQPGVAFMDMFYDGNSNRNEGNTEALWVWQWELETAGGGSNIMRRWHISRYNDISIGGVTPLEITVERGGRPRARMSLTKWAIELYEPQDDRASNYALRKFFVLKDEKQNDTGVADILPSGYSYGDTIWVDWANDITYATHNRTNWPFSRKWDWANPADITGGAQFNDQIYIRLAETYLLKAEAQLLLNDKVGAAETINIIRRRSNASDISSGDINIDFILDERSRELVMEEQRRYTLLRTGKWLERTEMYNHNGGANITERDKLFPIPQSVIDANLTKTMPQNPGY